MQPEYALTQHKCQETRNNEYELQAHLPLCETLSKPKGSSEIISRVSQHEFIILVPKYYSLRITWPKSVQAERITVRFARDTRSLQVVAPLQAAEHSGMQMLKEMLNASGVDEIRKALDAAQPYAASNPTLLPAIEAARSQFTRLVEKSAAAAALAEAEKHELAAEAALTAAKEQAKAARVRLKTAEAALDQQQALTVVGSDRGEPISIVESAYDNPIHGVEACCANCLEQQTHACVPCGHQCLCEACAAKMEDSTQVDSQPMKCPVCKGAVQSLSRVLKF